MMRGIMDEIDRIRAFSRIYTGRLGLLTKSYLGSGLGMAEVRVLHDLDGTDPVRPRILAQALGMDEGQMSRILAGFARRGWVERLRGQDQRERPVQLLPEGRALLASLRAASRAEVSTALAPLSAASRAALAQALERAGQLLSDPPPSVTLRDLASGDAGWVIERHAALYAQDEGYDSTFEALVARILADFLHRADPARERGFIAEAAGQRLGSIFCMAEGPDAPETARLRLFLIEPQARGTGIAQTMMEACLAFASNAGYRRMRLWTHESHRAAGRLYARNGFALVSRAPARAFGCDVVDQTWERALTKADSRLAITADRG